jgi:hypothetical protein
MSRDIRVLYAMEDDAVITELVSIARLHCRLALEYSRATTTTDRRKAIGKQIDSLRVARNALLERFAERESV